MAPPRINFSDLAKLNREFAQGINRTIDVLFKASYSLYGVPAPLNLVKQCPDDADQREELRITTWKMRRVLREAIGDGKGKEFIGALNSLAYRRAEMQQMVVGWIDLIEVLVQNAEQRYGATPGHGAKKAAEVRATMRYFLHSDRFGLPEMPELLEPFFIVMVNWSVDAVVLILNRYGLWVHTESSPQRSRKVLFFLGRFLHTLTRPLRMPFVWLQNRFRLAFRPGIRLSPEVQAAFEAIEFDDSIDKYKRFLKEVTDLTDWIAAYRTQLIAVVELVFAAVEEAESHFSLNGPEKKTCARDLVFGALEDFGLEQHTGVPSTAMDLLVGSAIEVAVHLFHKRGVFTSQSPDATVGEQDFGVRTRDPS